MRPMASATVTQEDREQLNDYPISWRRVMRLFIPHRRGLALVLALIISSSLINLATPFLTKAAIDRGIVQHNLSLLIILVVAMIAVTVVSNIISVIQTWRSTVIGQSVMHRLRSDVYAHLQRQPLSFFTRTRGGEVQSRLTNDISSMQSVVTNSATSIASNITTAIATLIAMVALSWQLSLFSLLVLPPSIWITRKVARRRRRITAQRQRAMAGLHTQIEESLSVNGAVLAKTMGATGRLTDSFEESSHALLKLEVLAQLAGRWQMAAMSIIFGVIPSLLYLAAGMSGISIGTLVAFVALQAGLFRPVIGVLQIGVQVISSKALFSRIFEYLDLPEEILSPPEAADIAVDSMSGHLDVERVSYTYPGADEPALADISFSAEPGHNIAIVGESGAGKSTLVSLLARLCDPSAGSIKIDGVDLREMVLEDVAELVAVVSQDTYLLHDTIEANLRFARPEATVAELEAAARAAQIHDLIVALPQGYQTMVGARGFRFSGGQKQRLALARTLLRDPKVLVLDEATSALDNETEREVQAALDEVSKDRTTITIAHRLSTVQRADLLLVFDRGRIVEAGTHAELAGAGGRYARLLARGDTVAQDLPATRTGQATTRVLAGTV